MTVKYFCDVCEKEVQPNQSRLMRLSPLHGEQHGDYQARVCKRCTDKVLGVFKVFHTVMTLHIDLPADSQAEEEDAKKGEDKPFSSEPESLLELCQDILELAQQGDYSNGNTAPDGAPGQGTDEGQVMASRLIAYYEQQIKHFEER